MLVNIWPIAKYLLTLHPHSGRWCNGNTTGFGSVIPGSNPSRPTIFRKPLQTFFKTNPCFIHF